MIRTIFVSIIFSYCISIAFAQIPGPEAREGMGAPLRFDSSYQPISSGYNSHADAADFDNDGDLDLVVHSALGGGAGNTFWGIHIYENVSPANSKGDLHFSTPQKILNLDKPVLAYDWNGDGLSDLIVDGKWYCNSGDFHFAEGVPIPHLPKGLKRIVDWNDDGVPDVLTGEKLPGDFWPTASVWKNGESPFTSDGIWKGGVLRGTLRYHQGMRKDGDVVWMDKGILKAGEWELEVYGEAHPTLADWDDDGDLDLMVGGLCDLTYFENEGDSHNPQLTPYRHVVDKSKCTSRGMYIRPTAVSFENGANKDLLVAQESGDLVLLSFKRLDNQKSPVYESTRRLLQEDSFLDAGCLSTISTADFDNDGDIDIVSGNSYGEIVFFMNQGQKKGWDRKRVQYVQAGPNGSIQGPNEVHFGYTCPVFCDWDRDGSIDLIVSDIWGKYTLYTALQLHDLSSQSGAPILCKSADKESFVPPWVWHKPKKHELITQWRCQPAVVDWDGDGLIDLITLDSEGYLALFPGKQISPPEVDAPQRDFLLSEGKPIRITNGLNGRAGRTRIVVADWDGDGDRDIVRGCTHAGEHEDANFADYERVAVWYENTGDDRNFQFRGSVLKNDGGVSFCGHATSPAVVDWDGNGSLDLLLGAEDGLIYFFKREYLDSK